MYIISSCLCLLLPMKCEITPTKMLDMIEVKNTTMQGLPIISPCGPLVFQHTTFLIRPLCKTCTKQYYLFFVMPVGVVIVIKQKKEGCLLHTQQRRRVASRTPNAKSCGLWWRRELVWPATFYVDIPCNVRLRYAIILVFLMGVRLLSPLLNIPSTQAPTQLPTQHRNPLPPIFSCE